MLSIAEIQHSATVVPDSTVTARVLLGGAALTATCGLLWNRRALGRWLPATLFVALSALAMWPVSGEAAWWWMGIVLTAAGGALAWHARQGPAEEITAVPLRRSRATVLYFLLAFGLAAFLLCYDLGGYSGDELLTWEPAVMFGFGKAFRGGEGLLHFTLQRLLWDDGILSAGNTSLFYGAPTYALFHLVGFSTWTLRCAAVVATLLSLAMAFLLARRFFGEVVAAALTVVLSLNPAVLFYGRYGGSPAGTMLAVLLAVFATWVFLERDGSAWWRALLCAAALYVATVQYSPARIVVLILLAFIPIALACQWRQLGWQRPLGTVLVAAAAIAVWHVEGSFDGQEHFLAARGEQFFGMVKNPEYIKALFGDQPVPPHLRAGPLQFADEIELLRRWLLITIPQYLQLIRPVLVPSAAATILGGDPPRVQLYYGPVVLFIAWGLVHSLRRWRSYPHLCLLLWVAAGTVPLLLTSRVDAHRIMLFVIPLSFWAAFGVWEASRVLAEARVPASLQHVLALGMIVTGIYSAVNLIYYTQPPRSVVSRALVGELESVSGRAMVGNKGWHRQVGWAYLRMLERTREDPHRVSDLLEEGLVHGLEFGQGSALEAYIRELRRTAAGATLLLLPADNFRSLGAALTAKGLRVTERGLPEFHVMRIDEATDATGPPNEQYAGLPTPVILPTPTPPAPIVLRDGPKQWVTEFKPLSVAYGFAPPKVDRTWDGSRLRIGGIEYAHGIGMHAWCRAIYPVADNATAFQAIVGISDGMRASATAPRSPSSSATIGRGCCTIAAWLITPRRRRRWTWSCTTRRRSHWL